MKLYAIKDLARNDYHGNPFFAENDDVAKRSWNAFCNSLASAPHVDISDFEVVELSYQELKAVFDHEEK